MRSGFRFHIADDFFLPVIGCSSAVPYNDDFLCALKVSHGADVSLSAVLSGKMKDVVITMIN